MLKNIIKAEEATPALLFDNLKWMTSKEAEREERKLIRECEREIFDQESKGSNWG